MPEVTRRNILRGGLLAATAVFTSKVFGDAPAARAAADGFAVAYNHLDITPQVGKGWGSLWMGGYGWGPRGASADPNVNHVPHRPLTAHCLAIHDNGSKNVILRLDVVSIPRDVHLEIRRRVLLAFEKAEREPDPVRRHAFLTFVVIGGGPTGVEMAGAVAEIRRYVLRRDFRHIGRDAEDPVGDLVDPRRHRCLLAGQGHSRPAHALCQPRHPG